MEQQQRTRRGTRPPRKIDPGIVTKLAPVMTCQEIANLQGVHRTTVMRFLHSRGIEPTQAELEEDLARDLLLSSRQAMDLKARIMNHYLGMGEDRFNALSEQTRTTLLGVVTTSCGVDYDKYRVQTGQATSINVTVMADLLEAVRQMRDK